MSKSTEEKPLFRLPYDDLAVRISDATGLFCEPDSSLTHQSFQDECDINKIIANLDASGFLQERSSRPYPPEFDASRVPDYHEAMNQVVYAQAAFAKLPAEVRARFANDPGNFVSFFDDPRNAEEAVRLGLATPREQGFQPRATPLSAEGDENPSSAHKKPSVTPKSEG